jgi:CelD/BcsL family acetyltransferase involved in cellulose biosynthesis
MTTSVCRPRELGAPEISAWHEFQSADLSLQNPFLSPEFARVVDSVREDARVAVAEEGGRPVGFLAYSVGPLRIARPIAPGLTDLQAFVHRPGLRWDPRQLLRGAGLAGWSFDHLLGRQAAEMGHAGPIASDKTWLVELAHGFDGYARWAMAERRRHFKWMEKQQRRFLSAYPDTAFSWAADDPDGLRALIDLKSEQCRRRGWMDLFGQRWARELVERLASCSSPALAGSVSALRVDDRVVSVDMSLRSETVYAAWIVAYQQELAQFSPGVVRWRYLLEAAAKEGIQLIDFGKGEDEFKRRFATTTAMLGAGLWTAGGSGSPLARIWRYAQLCRARCPGVEQRLRANVQTVRRWRYRADGLRA